jgi:serine/threonine protein kinase
LNNSGTQHRDIKPANILYDRVKGNYMITDYAMSSMFDLAYDDFDSFFHPIHQAPEVLFGGARKRERSKQGQEEVINFNTDTFSVGVMIYELLYLKTPWKYN